MSEQTPGPGADLKAARENLQVSVREVADALNLPSRVIEALEADDYERLAPSVFTRGYLRSYARLLELPADELLARYPEVTEEVEAVSDTRTGTFAAVSQSRQRLLPVAGGVVVALVLVIGWLFWGDNGEAPDVVEAPAAQRATEADRPAAEPARPEPEIPAEVAVPRTAPDASAERAGMDAGPADSTAPADAGPETELPVAGSTVPEGAAEAAAVPPAATTAQSPAEAGAAASSETAAETTRRERRITEFGDDQLVFRFTEDCWVEVKSADGEGLYSDLNRAGTTLVLTGRAPYRILLGYAPGVSLEFNGEPIALSRYSRNNVANLVLGQ